MCSGGGRKRRNRRQRNLQIIQEQQAAAAAAEAQRQQNQIQQQLNAQAQQARALANKPVPQAPEPLQDSGAKSGLKKKKSRAERTGRRALGTQQFTRPLNLGGYTGSSGGAPNV